MASVASPYGMLPIGRVGSRTNTDGVRRYPLISNSSSAFYVGAPVNIAAGVLTPLSASPTAGTAAGSALGVVTGIEYVDATFGLVETQYLPANAITNGATRVNIFVNDDPDTLFQVQANGSVANTVVGRNAAIQTFTGSSVTGKSSVVVNAAGIATTNTFALRIVGALGDIWGDAYTDLIVKWNFGAHQYHLPLGL